VYIFLHCNEFFVTIPLTLLYIEWLRWLGFQLVERLQQFRNMCVDFVIDLLMLNFRLILLEPSLRLFWKRC